MNKQPTTESKHQEIRKKKGGGATTGSAFDNLELFLLHLPTTIWFAIFCYAPMFGVIIAFKNYKARPSLRARLFTRPASVAMNA